MYCAGTEQVNEGDLILPLALRGDFLLGTRLLLQGLI